MLAIAAFIGFLTFAIPVLLLIGMGGKAQERQQKAMKNKNE